MSDDTFYTVEYLPKNYDGPGTWDQAALTDNWWLARFYKFETRLRLGRGYDIRIREI